MNGDDRMDTGLEFEFEESQVSGSVEPAPENSEPTEPQADTALAGPESETQGMLPEMHAMLEVFKVMLESGQFELVLENLPGERAVHPHHAEYQQNLDWVEKAARSILVIQKYKTADGYFARQDFDNGLRLYSEIIALMDGKFHLFGLTEGGVQGIVQDFMSKVSSGMISSYEEAMEYRRHMQGPLSEKFGESPDAKTIMMILDAHMSKAFFEKLREKGYDYSRPKKKRGLWWYLFGFFWIDIIMSLFSSKKS